MNSTLDHNDIRREVVSLSLAPLTLPLGCVGGGAAGGVAVRGQVLADNQPGLLLSPLRQSVQLVQPGDTGQADTITRRPARLRRLGTRRGGETG